MENFVIKDKVCKFIFTIHNNAVCNIPKSHVVFRDRLLNASFDLFDDVVFANLNTGNIRSKYQKNALLSVYKIDMLLGFIKDLGFIERKKFMSMIANLNEIKKMLNSWSNNEKTKK